ncbi:MAG: endonuclease/exonuclease/phosphatase family protein [Gammaproteobacteria bacterium]|nr:endonuclease/exonuclease/phosphatase family protein [Gammaproteobacteria bacterium]
MSRSIRNGPGRARLGRRGFIGGLAALVGGASWLAWTSSGSASAEVPPRPPGALRLASFNIHYHVPGHDPLDWLARREAVARAMSDLRADLVAFQEMETAVGGHFHDRNVQLDWVLSRMPAHAAAAVGDPRSYPWTQPILYRRDRLRPLAQGFFFFSEQPERIYSRTFDGGYPAFCSQVEFEDLRSGVRLVVFNVHFDHASSENRIRSARLVAARVEPILKAGRRVVVVGDLNAWSWFDTVQVLARLPLTLAPPAGSTYHFNLGLALMPAIDHVLYSRGLEQVGPTGVLNRRYDGVHPSDHHPIWVDLRVVEPQPGVTGAAPS